MDRDRQVLLPDGLVLRQSPIEGMGIFTTRAFPKGHRFGDYTGIEMSITNFNAQYGKDTRYCYMLTRTHKVICAKEPRNFITYVNDGLHGQVNSKVNTYCKKRGLYAYRDIVEDEELLLDYGKKYLW